MSELRTTASAAGISALRRLSRPVGEDATESCELCNVSLGPAHRHLLETGERRIVCACDACALCFQGVVGGRYLLIPRDPRPLTNFAITDEQWEGLALPIDLAFFFFHTPSQRVIALYPGPAGAVESSLPLTAWTEFAAGHPVLGRMEPDVEALLVNRTGKVPRYYVAPIDACYRLVGLIRLHWRGLAGGAKVWREIATFFAELEPRSPEAAPSPPEVSHA